MNKKQHSQGGFGAVEAMLLLIIILLIGFIGFYTYHAQKDTNKNLDASSSATQSTAPKSSVNTADSTAGRKSYTSASGHFSIKYPTDWVTVDKPSDCDAGNLFLLGVNASSAGEYCSDAGSEMSIDEKANNEVNCNNYALSNNDYTAITSERVTISGASGTKHTGVTKQGNTIGKGGLDVGLKAATYCLTYKSKTYVAEYIQDPRNLDVLSSFETMVSKTLKITE